MPHRPREKGRAMMPCDDFISPPSCNPSAGAVPASSTTSDPAANCGMPDRLVVADPFPTNADPAANCGMPGRPLHVPRLRIHQLFAGALAGPPHSPVGITRGVHAASQQAPPRLPLGITHEIQFRGLFPPPPSPLQRIHRRGREGREGRGGMASSSPISLLLCVLRVLCGKIRLPSPRRCATGRGWGRGLLLTP